MLDLVTVASSLFDWIPLVGRALDVLREWSDLAVENPYADDIDRELRKIERPPAPHVPAPPADEAADDEPPPVSTAPW